MDLRGKRALVTGGAVRIGRAICEALAAEGCEVVIHYRRSGADARSLAAAIRARGGRALCVRGELTGERACERVVAEARRAAGGLDILVNNAAVFHKDSLRTSTRAKTQAELDVNLLAPMAMMRAFAARTAKGAIVNLLDRRIASHDLQCLPYLLSKKALAALTQSAALELAPGIAVNGVAPGPVLPPPGKGTAYLRDHAGTVPMARRVTPAEVAAAVVFLLKSEAITGQIVFVDGGQHLLGNGV